MCIRQPVVVRGKEAPALHKTIQDVQDDGGAGWQASCMLLS